MPLTKEQGERLGRCTETFFMSLNQSAVANPASGYSIHDHPYRPCSPSPERRDIAFSVSVRAPIGQRHPDGMKWKTLDGPTWQDAEIIAQTCQSDEEVLEHFHNIVFKGIRPMRLGSGHQITEQAINQIVEDRVRQILEAKLQQIQRGQDPTANAAVQRIEAAEKAETKAWEPQVAVSDSLLATWTERAKILGLDPPKIAKKGRIDGRWMRNAQDKWRAHQATKSPEPAA